MTPGRRLIGQCKTLGYLQSSLRGMRFVFNRSFHQRETKIRTINASVMYGLQLLVRDPDLRLLADAAVSETLAYDCLLNPKLARQRGYCAGQSDHNFSYMV